VYTRGEDLANRALQYCGATRIATFLDNTKQAAETGFTYPLIRQAELRRAVWRCAIKRSVLRPFTNTMNRFVAPAWALTTVYVAGQIVQDSVGTYWIAMFPNTATAANAPGVYTAGQPQWWQQWFGTVYGDQYSHTTSYYAGELVYAGSLWYISNINGNVGNDIAGTPTAAEWIAQTGAAQWGAEFFLPVGPGVTINGVARNLYPLPLYYLRVTNQDPKVGSTATNVVSAGLRFSDWEFESNYLVSASTTPIVFRYVADVADVTMLDPLLCEALAARIAFSVCEILTQSNIKLQAIAAAYQKFMHDARMINLIETGSTEDSEENYVLTNGPAGVMEGGGGQQQGQSGPGQGG
jgi:hypothetical protein